MSADAQPRPVATVGRYEVGTELASGGMATVYLARASGPSGFEKLVALKRVQPHLAKEPTFVEMFLDEARIASRIQHPNVCQVFDFGEADGEYFIAMEFLVGETLGKMQRAIARSPLLNDPRRPFVLARLLVDCCEGLHAAHELRDKTGQLLEVVHRDVSPQNLFVTYDGNAKVVDFGIASASDRLHQTSTGTVKGKFAYMEPEQAKGHKVDRRADVWALGVVLWELLTFRRLFRRDAPAETLVALLSDEIIPPSKISRLAPPELDEIVLRALSRDRDERYATARDLGRDLSRALGRLGDAVDRAEVAEWLEQLFPEGRSQHSILLESARWGEAERTERSDPGAVSEVVSRSTWSGVASSDALANPADVVEVGPPPPAPHASGSMQVPSTTAPAIPEVPARRSSAIRWVAQGAFALVVMAVTVIVLVQLIEPAQVTTTVIPAGPPRVEPVAMEPVGVEPVVVEQAGADQAIEPATQQQDQQPGPPELEQAALEAEVPGEAPRTPARSKRPPRDRGRATQSGTGTVVVSTPGGWANVYGATGRFLGETPLTTTLPEGTHRLTLRPYGQPPSHAVSVTVRPGETARVTHRL